MPQANKDFTKKTKLSVTGFVHDIRFGLKDEAGNGIPLTGFRGYTLNSDGYKTLMNHAQIGATLVFRKSKAKNKNNEEQWFLEILPPRENTGNGYKVKTTSNESDI